MNVGAFVFIELCEIGLGGCGFLEFQLILLRKHKQVSDLSLG